MKVVLIVLAFFFIVGTLLPLLSYDQWTIRIFEFPRAQLTVIGLLVTGGYLVVWDPSNPLDAVVLTGLLACILHQGYKMFPYTPLADFQVVNAEHNDPDTRFRLLIANVRISNRDARPLRRQIEQHDPDLVLTLEPDAWWEEQLRPIEADYPYAVKHPLDNAYGMMLYSRLPLIDPEVRFIVEDDLPSIHTRVELPSGMRVFLHAVHPRPPHPSHDKDTTERDAELLMLGREVREHGGPTVVAGDLNDVSWSYTTRLFQEISDLLDPRIGRGTYSTYHAEHPVMRYPLDHVFHSDHFTLVRLERLPYIGSDHFPVLIELQYEPEAPRKQPEPEADADSREQVQYEIDKLKEEEDIEDGRP